MAGHVLVDCLPIGSLDMQYLQLGSGCLELGVDKQDGMNIDKLSTN